MVGSFLALVWGGPADAQSTVPARACDAVDVDPWVRDAATRIESRDALFEFAEGAFGAALACEGAVTAEFDGAPFGLLRYRFPEGRTFQLETMPPSVGIVTLSAPAGFDDPGAVREAARRYSEGLGFAVVWDAPERTARGDEVTEQFWDPDPGLNASVSLTWTSGVLTAVRVSSAP